MILCWFATTTDSFHITVIWPAVDIEISACLLFKKKKSHSLMLCLVVNQLIVWTLLHKKLLTASPALSLICTEAAASWSKANMHFNHTSLLCCYFADCNVLASVFARGRVWNRLFLLPGPPSPPSPPSFWTHTGGRRARKEGRGGERRVRVKRGGSPLSCPPTQDPLWSPAWVWAKRNGEDACTHTQVPTHNRTHTHTHTHTKNTKTTDF